MNKVSDASLIKFFEDCKLTVYPDTNGYATVGWGHLVKTRDNLKIGDKITQNQAELFLHDDLINAEQTVNRLVMIPVKQNEFDTLVSLAFNLSYRSMLKLATYLNDDKQKFVEKMLLYCKDASGNFLKGLKIRRIAERLYFEGREWLQEAKQMQTSTLEEVIKREAQLFRSAIPDDEIPQPRGIG